VGYFWWTPVLKLESRSSIAETMHVGVLLADFYLGCYSKNEVLPGTL